MKHLHHLKTTLLWIVFALLFTETASAQLNVASNSNAAALAAKLVGPGVTITNASLDCANGAAGTFTTGTVNEVGIGTGVLLTTGNVSIAASANNSESATIENGHAGNSILDALIPGYQTYDACMLEFDLEAIGNKVSFNYVFASEEYEEWYCSDFNDVFGFFVSGPIPGPATYTNKNIAIVPETANVPVSINNVGPGTCNGISNTFWYVNMAGATTVQYDGKTKKMTASVDLTPCKTYRFKLGVADAGDRLLDSGIFLEEGSFVSSPPVIACSANIIKNSEPGKCSAVATYSPTVSADCPVTATCTPASGATFPVGVTMVTCKATDQLGNTATCTFTVTVNDNEKPVITCPAQITVSCEAPTTPNAVGFATATDNCGLNPFTHVDATVNGSCTHEYTINRTWTAHDTHGNTSSCVHVIKVEDKKPPTITCPVNVTVTCDTTAAATGLATAVDNCDPVLDFSRFDTHANGDCDWFCIVERTFQAKDDCRNTSTCVQIITKNTAPLIETALPVTVGMSNSFVTVPPGRADCVIEWLPPTGTIPKGLGFKKIVVDASCDLLTNPTTPSGKIINPLFGEALKLSIFVKLKPSLGTKKLTEFASCDILKEVTHYLAPDPDVNELLRVTNGALGNISNQPHMYELLEALECINGPLDPCNL